MLSLINMVAAGHLTKMKTQLKDSAVLYHLPLGETFIPLNQYLEHKLTIQFTGAIHCVACNRKTSKSFNQGYCYPCFKKLAACDSCIVKPETCHYHQNTCREPEWADQFCMTEHIVYLANSTGIKVGITRKNQIPTRWIDQGAIQALPIFVVATRQLSGFVEVLFKQQVNDKTNWRALLKGNPPLVNLASERDRLLNVFAEEITDLQNKHGLQAVQILDNEKTIDICYPVHSFPDKITPLNLDKQSVVSGILKGIKGQYLVLDSGVLNIRKFTAYHVTVSVD